jgi:hypothetical protein
MAEIAPSDGKKEETKALLIKGTVKLNADKYVNKAPSNAKGKANGEIS